VALLLFALAPPIVLSGVAPDRFEVALLLLLLAAKGAGWLSLDGELRGFRLWGAPAWWLWGLVHVLLLAGGRNRAAVVLNWLWAYLTYRRGTRLITGSMMDV
jgi:hypothetical protein